MFTQLRYIVLTASRDLLFAGLFLAIVLATVLSAALGNTAMVEKEAMTVTFSAASMRVILMVGLIVFVCFHLRQAFEQKEIDLMASRPLSRSRIVLAYALGFGFVAFLLTLGGVTVLSFLPIASREGFLCWAVSLLLESWLVVAAALFASFTLRSAVTSVLASLAIYVVGRMLGFFLLTAQSGLLFHVVWLNQALEWSIQAVAFVLPRLDLFGQSDWLVYGLTRTGDISLVALQALAYIPLLVIATAIDFERKEF